jgi:hypothetical protein
MRIIGWPRAVELRRQRAVPPALGRLLDRSYDLYSRVERLDAMVAANVSQAGDAAQSAASRH